MIILDRDNPLRNPDRAPFAQAIDRTIIVADFEFRANQEKYDKYLANDGDSAHKKPRWTFNDIVCAAWVVIRFPAGAPEPEVSAFHSFCAPEMDEIDILDTFFGVLEEEAKNSEQPVPLVTWAGDFVDIAVLRHMSEEWDVLLPPQLRSTEPLCPHRLDLCEVSYTKEMGGVHLSEYAQSQGLPGKPIPGREISKCIEAGDWKRVEEQCAADVMLTAILAARRLASSGQIYQAGKACTRAIVDRFCKRTKTNYIRKLKKWRKENLSPVEWSA